MCFRGLLRVRGPSSAASASLPAAVHAQAQTCWDRAVESAGGLEERQRAVHEFNERSRFRKRGLAMTPTKFGISFTTKFLNQVRPLAWQSPAGACQGPTTYFQSVA